MYLGTQKYIWDKIFRTKIYCLGTALVPFDRGLQRTTPNRLGAQTSTLCIRILWLPPTTFLFLWLRNKIHFAVVVGTKTTRWTRDPPGVGWYGTVGWYETQWFNSTRQIECVSLLPSLVVHHHLTKVILSFLSHKFSSRVIGILNNFE